MTYYCIIHKLPIIPFFVVVVVVVELAHLPHPTSVIYMYSNFEDVVAGGKINIILRLGSKRLSLNTNY